VAAPRFPDYEPTVPVFLAQVTKRFGANPLILLGERRISYAEAERASARTARGLVARGFGKGSRIAVLAPNGPDWLVWWLAVTRIGAVMVPLNTFYKPRELGYVLRHSDASALVTVARYLSNDYLERLETCAPGLAGQRAGALYARELPHLRHVFVSGDAGGRAYAEPVAALDAAADANPAIDAAFLAEVEACVTPSDPMLVIYSSGSTADPKGAVHSHGAPLRHAYNTNQFRDFEPSDRIYSPMPFFWVGGFVFSLLAGMHAGAFLLCEEVFEPGATLALLERERATVAGGWPHYSKALAEHPSFASRDLSSIRSGNLYAVLPESARPADPELRSNSLGMTETCGPHTYDRMDVDLPGHLRGSFGHAVPGVEHKIVDPETGATLPPGEFGEICVRGYSVMLGLHKHERDDVFDRDGYYHTGDAGYFDADGVLYFKARLGEMIKTAGANVTPREVEVEIERFPEVSSAFVVGLPDPVRGQNVAAALVLKRGAQLDADTARARLREQLSSYKMPRDWWFAAKEELPFTDSGKIDKKRLAALFAARLAERGKS
jgi:acyl-CoA synthetase (AMP-forming)/AMP-acid ligase II